MQQANKQPTAPPAQLLSFSRHALQRMASRNIALDADQQQRLESAVLSLNTKGGRNALVLLDGTALVVSVTHGRVITVVDGPAMHNNIFTNIDSAMLA